MAQYHYLAVLFFVAVCGIFIATLFRIKERRFWRLFVLTDLIILAIYLIWDYWAISKNTWYFDTSQILGLKIFGKVPIEEIIFFIIVPFTSLLTYLALKKLTKWNSLPK